MSFAENLRQIREEKNISQEKLAELLDVSRQAVSKWEQGIGYPEVEKLLLLSKELDISLDSLMETEIALSLIHISPAGCNRLWYPWANPAPIFFSWQRAPPG